MIRELRNKSFYDFFIVDWFYYLEVRPFGWGLLNNYPQELRNEVCFLDKLPFAKKYELSRALATAILDYFYELSLEEAPSKRNFKRDLSSLKKVEEFIKVENGILKKSKEAELFYKIFNSILEDMKGIKKIKNNESKYIIKEAYYKTRPNKDKIEEILNLVNRECNLGASDDIRELVKAINYPQELKETNENFAKITKNSHF